MALNVTKLIHELKERNSLNKIVKTHQHVVYNIAL